MLDLLPHDIIYYLVFSTAKYASATDDAGMSLRRIQGFHSLTRTTKAFYSTWSNIKRDNVSFTRIVRSLMGGCYFLGLLLAVSEKSDGAKVEFHFGAIDSDYLREMSTEALGLHILMLRWIHNDRAAFQRDVNHAQLCKALYIFAVYGNDDVSINGPNAPHISMGIVAARQFGCEREYIALHERLQVFTHDWIDEFAECCDSLEQNDYILLMDCAGDFANLLKHVEVEWRTMGRMMMVWERDGEMRKLCRRRGAPRKAILKRAAACFRWMLFTDMADFDLETYELCTRVLARICNLKGSSYNEPEWLYYLARSYPAPIAIRPRYGVSEYLTFPDPSDFDGEDEFY